MAIYLEDYKDLISTFATIATICQFLTGSKICRDFMRKGHTGDVSGLPLVVGALNRWNFLSILSQHTGPLELWPSNTWNKPHDMKYVTISAISTWKQKWCPNKSLQSTKSRHPPVPFTVQHILTQILPIFQLLLVSVFFAHWRYSLKDCQRDWSLSQHYLVCDILHLYSKEVSDTSSGKKQKVRVPNKVGHHKSNNTPCLYLSVEGGAQHRTRMTSYMRVWN